MTTRPTNSRLSVDEERNGAQENANFGWWRRRSRLERHLTLGVFSVVFVVVVLAFCLAAFVRNSHINSHHTNGATLPSPAALQTIAEEALPKEPIFFGSSSTRPCEQSAEDQTDNVCLTKGCVTAAANLIATMDESVDPCTDFYQFNCGKFSENTIIPDEKSSVTSFSLIGDKLTEKLRLLVEKDIVPEDSEPVVMSKNLFKSCMNKAVIEKEGLTPLLDILDELGGWPVLEGDLWDENGNFSWLQHTYNCRRLGYSADTLFDFSVSIDVRNSTWRTLWFDQPSVGMSREHLMKGENDSDVQAYLQFMVDSAQLLGATKEAAEEEMLEVLRFQIQLANISLPREERRNASKLYNKFTLSELEEKYPIIPWVEYVNNLLPEHIQVDENETAGVSVPNYFENFTKIMESTSNRTIANYLLWRVTSATLTYLNEAARKVTLDYSIKLTGRATRPPRWKECMGIVGGRLSYAIAQLYIRHYFNEEAKSKALEIIDYVTAEFDEILRTVDWMDEETRMQAKKKAEAISTKIAYPPELLQNEKLMEYYGGLEVNDGNLLLNMINLSKFGTNYTYSRLRERVDKTDWKRNGAVAVVNAYYSSVENSIKFPAGILQGVFFSPDRPNYLNFGAVGYVAGHEITHGFDDRGKQFDAEGNLKNWWQPQTEKKFIQKSKCIIHQYGNYSVPEVDMKLNGINTQGENIADNGGIKQAYHAYSKWVAKNGQEMTLPGLSYSQRQLFWISAAQVWCAKYRPKSLKLRILTGVHSPGRYRVMGPMSNSEEFSKDWNCPVGSVMNPVKKCHVW